MKMADVERVQFSSVEQEAVHWHEVALKYKNSYESVKEEMEDFQSSSRELELELEAQLTQAENKNKELTSLTSRLQTEVDSLKDKLEKLQSSSFRQISELETQLAKSEAYSDRMQKYIRELEQTNDDLERAKRAAVVSLEDFEVRLNQAIERNAFLESELDEKENLVVCVQRLKDEARDLRHELAAHSKHEPELKSEKEAEAMEVETQADAKVPKSHQDILPGAPGSGDNILPSKVDTIPLKIEMVTPARASCQLNAEDITRQRIESATPGRNSSFMTASPINTSTRISALNIVSDLLRKVGALESKLNSCRNTSYNQTPSGQRGRDRNSPGSPTNSPSSKRASIGSGLPMSSSVGQSGYVQITV
jgi:DNA repair exonuclease SbcCD ATPase subunit